MAKLRGDFGDTGIEEGTSVLTKRGVRTAKLRGGFGFTGLEEFGSSAHLPFCKSGHATQIEDSLAAVVEAMAKLATAWKSWTRRNSIVSKRERERS